MNTLETPTLPEHAETNGHAMSHPVEIQQDFDAMPKAVRAFNMLTVPGFLRKYGLAIDRRIIIRFGDEVKKMADSWGLNYATTVDNAVGGIRVYPQDLMLWVYRDMAREFRWADIIDADDEKAEEQGRLKGSLRRNHRLMKQLHEKKSQTDAVEDIAQITAMIGMLEKENINLSAQLEALCAPRN